MKAGIMEIGDVFAINKADRDGVLRTERELKVALYLGAARWLDAAHNKDSSNRK